MTSPPPMEESWARYEANTMSRRRELCSQTLAALLGGNPSEMPRIALCLGGAPGWTTALSSLAFIDGLSVPLQATSTQRGQSGVKMMDGISAVSFSSSCAWVGAAAMAAGPAQDPFHDRRPSSSSANTAESGSEAVSWWSPEALHLPDTVVDEARKGIFSASLPLDATNSSAAALRTSAMGPSNGSPRASVDPLVPPLQTHRASSPLLWTRTFSSFEGSLTYRTDRSAQPRRRSPWAFGTDNGFDEGLHAYNGVVEMLSAQNLSQCAQNHNLTVVDRIVFSAVLGSHLAVPLALLNPHLGSSTMERWATFIGDVWLGSSVLPASAGAPSLSHEHQLVMDSPPHQAISIFDHRLRQAMASGEFPLMIFSVAEVPIADTLQGHTANNNNNNRDEPPSLVAQEEASATPASPQWVEYNPFFVRRYTNATTVFHNQALQIHLGQSNEGWSRRGRRRAAFQPLQLHHMMGLCSASLPHAITESRLLASTAHREAEVLLHAIGGDDAALEEDDGLGHECRRGPLEMSYHAISSPRLNPNSWLVMDGRKVQAATPVRVAPRPRTTPDDDGDASREEDPEFGRLRCGLFDRLHAQEAEEPTLMCRESTSLLRAPLHTLLREPSGRAFDLVVVHDTCGGGSDGCTAAALSRAVELGYYKLKRDEVDPSTPFSPGERVRVFHGEPGHPTIIYFLGVPAGRCMESSMQAEDIRRTCKEIRDAVMESVVPAVVAQSRRWRYMATHGLSELNATQERAYMPVQLSFTLSSHRFPTEGNRVEDVVWHNVRRRATQLEHTAGQQNDAQLVRDAAGIETVAIATNEFMRGRDGDIRGIYRFFITLDRLIAMGYPAARRTTVMEHAARAALFSITSTERRSLDFNAVLREADNADVRMVCEALQYNMMMFGNPADSGRSRSRTSVPRQRVFSIPHADQSFAGASYAGPMYSADAMDELRGQVLAWMRDHPITLTTSGVALFAAVSLLGVFTPHSDLLFRQSSRQIASIGDYTRIQWLRLPEASPLLTILMVFATAMGTIDELLDALVESVIPQIKAYLIHHPVDGASRGKTANNNTGASPSSLRIFCALLSTALEGILVGFPGAACKARVRQVMMRIANGLLPPETASAKPTMPQHPCARGHHIFLTLLASSTARRAHDSRLLTVVMDVSRSLLLLHNCHESVPQMRTSPACYVFPRSWTAFCFNVVEAIYGNPLTEVRASMFSVMRSHYPVHGGWLAQPDLRQAMDAAEHIPGEAAAAAGKEWSMEELTHTYEKVSRIPFCGNVRAAYRLVLPSVLQSIIPYAQDDVRGVMLVLQAQPCAGSAAQGPMEERRSAALHLFFTRGVRTKSFLKRLIDLSIRHNIFLPYLAPVMRNMTIPSYADNPEECARRLRQALKCPQLSHLSFEQPNSARPCLSSSFIALPPLTKPPAGHGNSRVAGGARALSCVGSSAVAARSLGSRAESHHETSSRRSRESSICPALPTELLSLYATIQKRIADNKRDALEQPTPLVDAQLGEVIEGLFVDEDGNPHNVMAVVE